MKKISTLAVALITLGSLVTPAQADKVSTETLPSGYYKITSAAYSSAEGSKFPWGYMLNDYFLEGNTNHATLLAKSFKDNANNYIWKITNNGTATTIAIVNGQGTPIKREDGASKSYTYKEHSTLTPLLSNSDVTTNTYLFSEYLNTPGTGDPNHGYGDGAYKAVAYWDKNTGSTTKWKLENLNISDENVYTVSISGGNSSCYVTRTLTDGSEVAFNGGFFVSTTTDAISDDTRAFTASALEDHKSIITINSTDKTISVVYTPSLAGLKKLINTAKNIQAIRGVGYPTTTSTNYGALEHVITTAEAVTTEDDAPTAYNALQTQIATYKSNKVGIQMPEDGKVYRIYGLWDDNSKIYAVNKEGLLVNNKYSTSGNASTQADKTDLWVAQVVDGHYEFANGKGDKLFTYVDQGAANYTPTNSLWVVASRRANSFGKVNITTESSNTNNIALNKNGQKMGQFGSSKTYVDVNWSTEWVFEEVSTSEFAGQTVNFAASTDSKNYATLNLPYASTLPTGVTAYKATVEGTTVNLTEYKTENQVLPANTPVLLTATTDGEKTFAPATYAAAEKTGFQGTLSAKAVTATNTYILSRGNDGTVKFFALDETSNTINANKAYLVVSGGSAQALNFNFGNTTGIQNAAVEGVNANAPLFDLSGRRVVKAVKGGIYIQNGKKFVK